MLAYMQAKTCECCRKSFLPAYRVTKRYWAKRRFCSDECKEKTVRPPRRTGTGRPISARFWEKVRKRAPTECWEWSGTRIHRRLANQRRDALHKFSRMLVNTYQQIYVGDVSSTGLTQTRMAKSVLDSGWGLLKTQLQYKGQQAGRGVEIVNERYTTRACSGCGALTGPAGRTGLVVRQWKCGECGDSHDRDVNAARNILTAGLRCRASVRGNESSDSPVPSNRLRKRRRETGTDTARTAA